MNRLMPHFSLDHSPCRGIIHLLMETNTAKPPIRWIYLPWSLRNCPVLVTENKSTPEPGKMIAGFTREEHVESRILAYLNHWRVKNYLDEVTRLPACEVIRLLTPTESRTYADVPDGPCSFDVRRLASIEQFIRDERNSAFAALEKRRTETNKDGSWNPRMKRRRTSRKSLSAMARWEVTTPPVITPWGVLPDWSGVFDEPTCKELFNLKNPQTFPFRLQAYAAWSTHVSNHFVKNPKAALEIVAAITRLPNGTVSRRTGTVDVGDPQPPSSQRPRLALETEEWPGPRPCHFRIPPVLAEDPDHISDPIRIPQVDIVAMRPREALDVWRALAESLGAICEARTRQRLPRGHGKIALNIPTAGVTFGIVGTNTDVSLQEIVSSSDDLDYTRPPQGEETLTSGKRGPGRPKGAKNKTAGQREEEEAKRIAKRIARMEEKADPAEAHLGDDGVVEQERRSGVGPSGVTEESIEASREAERRMEALADRRWGHAPTEILMPDKEGKLHRVTAPAEPEMFVFKKLELEGMDDL